MAKEPGIHVRNNANWQPLKTIHISKEQLSHINRICGFLARAKMNHLRKSVNHNKDGIITSLSTRQPQHKVHAYVSPKLGEDW